MSKSFKYQLSVITIFLSVFFISAQNLDLTLYPEDYVTSHWKEVNTASLDISEVAFVNWNSGGSNSISGLIGAGVMVLLYKKLLNKCSVSHQTGHRRYIRF